MKNEIVQKIFKNFIIKIPDINIFFPISVTRGCYTKDTTDFSCKKGADTEQCLCDSDYCNSANSLTIKFSIFSSLLIYLLLLR